MSGNEGNERTDRITHAVTDLAKGLKAVQFYPENHPSLKKILEQTRASLEEIPIPEDGIALEVTKHALLFEDFTLPERHAALLDLRTSLFLRRTEKLIILPGVSKEEIKQFLQSLTLDPAEIIQMGGIEEILVSKKVSKIWINKVDYERLTEEMKEKDEGAFEGDTLELVDEPLGTEEMELIDTISFLKDHGEPEHKDSFDALISAIEKEEDPSKYIELVEKLSNLVNEMENQERGAHLDRVVGIYTTHMGNPPGGKEEIKPLAAEGIRKISDMWSIDIYINKFKNKKIQEHTMGRLALLALGKRAVSPLLDSLATEEDLTLRKSLVDLIAEIGTDSIPDVLALLHNSQWFVIRNMLTILGKIGNEEAASHVVEALEHGDPRVKKEAIKSLSRIPGTIATEALGECCFDGNDSIKSIAITSLGGKKDDRAVDILYGRFLAKKLIFPDIRIGLEVIDALKNIGSDKAISALKNISLYNPLFKPKKVKELKAQAVRSIGKINSPRSKEVLEELSKYSDTVCRNVASKYLKRTVHEPDGN